MTQLEPVTSHTQFLKEKLEKEGWVYKDRPDKDKPFQLIFPHYFSYEHPGIRITIKYGKPFVFYHTIEYSFDYADAMSHPITEWLEAIEESLFDERI